MYTERYVQFMEMTNMGSAIENYADHTYDPVRVLEHAEEDHGVAALLGGACTKDEAALMTALESLVDHMWRQPHGKNLRGELRRMFTNKGRSVNRFYAAFHALEERYHEC